MAGEFPIAADPRPRSAVSHGVGLSGLAGLLLWAAIAKRYGMDGPLAGLVSVAACALPMVGWSVLVDRVHRRPSTGIAWDRAAAPWRETLPISLVKLAGLWVTWGLIALFYGVGRWYWSGQYLFAMNFFGWALPWLAALSIPYVLWLDRRLAEPRDGAYHFGLLLMGDSAADGRAVIEHARSWAVKGFFSAFMVSIVPGNWTNVLHADLHAMLGRPLALEHWLIDAMFLVDVSFATGGYLLTLKPLDSHIRSANPYAAGWMAALICYPPFILMNGGGPLDYRAGTAEWDWWLAGHPTLAAANGVLLVILTGIYAWATVAFGIRFSNLTNRGILTHGPYRWSKHPAYVSKNLFWWLSAVPFLATTGQWSDAVRNTAILAAVSGVYYWRARTEERHLMADPAYVAYAGWMERNAPLPRVARRLARRGRSVTLQPAE